MTTILIALGVVAAVVVGLVVWLIAAWRRQESLPEYESDKEE